MLKLVIANKNYSTWSLRPWLLLKAFAIPFEEIQLSLLQTGLKERFGAFSPTGRVPVLIDGDLTVWDSLAICETVSERWLNGQGWPDDAGQRAVARSLCAEMHSGFTGLRGECPMNLRARRQVELSKAAADDLQRIDQIWSDCLASHAADGGWLFGRFSIVDCMYAPVALRLPTYGIALSATASQFVDRIRQHPAVREWVAAAALETEIIPEDEAGIPVQVIPQ